MVLRDRARGLEKKKNETKKENRGKRSLLSPVNPLMERNGIVVFWYIVEE